MFVFGFKILFRSLGTNAAVVEECLYRAVSQTSVEQAKKSGELFSFNLSGRRNDESALFLHKNVLQHLLEKCGSTCIDKKILLDGLVAFAEKMGMKLRDVGDQAYALKLMLMQLRRSKGNMKDGSRVAPWLRELLVLVDDTEPMAADQAIDDSQVGPLLRSRSPNPRRGSVLRADLLKNLPDQYQEYRPQHVHFRESSDDDDDDDDDQEEESTDSSKDEEIPLSAQKGEPLAIGDTTNKSAGQDHPARDFMYYWDESRGAMRVHAKLHFMQEADATVPGDDGFVVGQFGEHRQGYEIPNLRLEEMTQLYTAVLKRPAGPQPAKKRPAAKAPVDKVDKVVLKRPAGHNKCSATHLMYSSVYANTKRRHIQCGKTAAEAVALAKQAARAATAELRASTAT